MPKLVAFIETSFAEEEVFNAETSSHDDIELVQDEDNTASGNNTVIRITVEDAIQQEKCIVFTDVLMSLLKELHG